MIDMPQNTTGPKLLPIPAAIWAQELCLLFSSNQLKQDLEPFCRNTPTLNYKGQGSARYNVKFTQIV